MPSCKRALIDPGYVKAREALIGRAERLADDEAEGVPSTHYNQIHARAFSLAMVRLAWQHGLIDYNPQDQEPPVPLVLPKVTPKIDYNPQDQEPPVPLVLPKVTPKKVAA